MARGTRTLLAVSVASAVAAGAVLFAAAAMALGVAGRARPTELAVTGALLAAFVVWGASSMLVRRVARPVERILGAARELQESAPSDLLVLGDAGIGLDQAGLAFERTAAALSEERARLDQLAREDHADMLRQLGITRLRPGFDGRAAAGAPNAANYDPARANPYPDWPDGRPGRGSAANGW